MKESLINSDLNEQERRIIKNLQGSLIKQFQYCIINFQSVSEDIKSTKQNITIRNAEIIMSRKLDVSEKERVLHNPQIIQDILQDKLQSTAHTKVTNAMADLEERHRDIIRLEKVISIY